MRSRPQGPRDHTDVRHPPRSAADEVSEQLESEIVEGVRAPGARLTAQAVALQLGVSRTPVREAFKALERSGWIEVHPNAGAYVRTPSLHEIRDVLETVRSIDVTAAGLAAARADTAAMREVEGIVDAALEAVRDQDVAAGAAEEFRFHAAVLRATDNGVLEEVGTDLHQRLRWQTVAARLQPSSSAWQDRAALVAALHARDEQLATSLAREHALRRLQAFVDQVLRTKEPLPGHRI